jgi:hypothetical protein
MQPPDVSGVCDRLHLLTSPADYATEAELYGTLLTESAEPEERSPRSEALLMLRWAYAIALLVS